MTDREKLRSKAKEIGFRIIDEWESGMGLFYYMERKTGNTITHFIDRNSCFDVYCWSIDKSQKHNEENKIFYLGSYANGFEYSLKTMLENIESLEGIIKLEESGVTPNKHFMSFQTIEKLISALDNKQPIPFGGFKE